MNSADTQTRLENLHDGLARAPQGTRFRRVAVAVAAAAAVVAAFVLAAVPSDDRSVAPAGAVDNEAAESLAADFVDALASYDAARAASYLADDARVTLWSTNLDVAALESEIRWTQAAGMRLLPRGCEYEGDSGPAATVRCAFDFHGLGSQRLGRGPFSDNAFRLTVVDGKIVAAELSAYSDPDVFGATMWEPFTAWLLSSHADEAAHMFADWPGVTLPALDERSARLWTRNVERYVSAVERGEAS